MDVFSHGLWTAIAAKAASKKIKKLKIWQTVLWGVFPDVFSFAAMFAWLIAGIILGNIEPSRFRPDEAEPAPGDTLFIFRLTSMLYSVSHSIVIFAAVFALVSLIFRRPIFEMLGWLFHILIDIPTHSYRFYPTPFLWPVSEWKLDGVSWGTPWFMAINYSVLAILLVIFFLKNRRKNNN
jgi:hypothetical protein